MIDVNSYMEKSYEYFKDKTIEYVNLIKDHNCLIQKCNDTYFETKYDDPCRNGRIQFIYDSGERMEIIARAGCCSYSWFCFSDTKSINYVIEKKIKSIEYLSDVDLPSSKTQKCDRNHLYQIIFNDDTNYQFILRNSSSGFYDGWIDIDVITTSTEIEPKKGRM